MRLVSTSTPSSGQMSEAERVACALAGDRKAFRHLYDAHVDAVAGLCIRMLRNRERGMDAAQETFATAFQKLAQLTDHTQFGAWCKQIAVNVCLMAMRKDRWLRFVGWELESPDDVASAGASPTEALHARMDLEKVATVLRAMPPVQRVAWTLKHVEQESLLQIATLTGRSVASTKRDIDAAEHEIQRRLGDQP